MTRRWMSVRYMDTQRNFALIGPNLKYLHYKSISQEAYTTRSVLDDRDSVQDHDSYAEIERDSAHLSVCVDVIEALTIDRDSFNTFVSDKKKMTTIKLCFFLYYITRLYLIQVRFRMCETFSLYSRACAIRRWVIIC